MDGPFCISVMRYFTLLAAINKTQVFIPHLIIVPVVEGCPLAYGPIVKF